MKEPQPHIDEALIAKYLAKEATPEEEAALLEAAGASPEIREMLRQLSQIWEKTAPPVADNMPDFDLERAWQSMEPRIRPTVALKAPRTISLRLRWIAGVAAVLVLGTCFALLYPYLSPRQEHLTTVQATIENSVHTLPEGSTITLRKGSKLTYNPDFQENKRTVSVQGIAFFEVTPDVNKPFVVETGGVEVEVLGTSFFTQAAPDSSAVEVGVQTGKVLVRGGKNQPPVYLTAGESVVYFPLTSTFGPVAPVNVNRMYWKTGTLVFKDAPLPEVFAQLETCFNQTFVYNPDTFRSCRLTGRFSGNEVKEILDQIKLSFDLTYTVGATVVIDGEGC